MPIYAAYGSNMDPEQMLKRCPHSPVYGTGWLEGWRLTFVSDDIGWEGPLATVVEEPGSRVFVVLYDVSAEDELSLDRWEGSDFGIHKKIRLRVTPSPGTGTEPVLAWLYVLDAYEGGLPSARYIGVISDAAEKAYCPCRLRPRPAHPQQQERGPGNLRPLTRRKARRNEVRARRHRNDVRARRVRMTSPARRVRNDAASTPVRNDIRARCIRNDASALRPD